MEAELRGHKDVILNLDEAVWIWRKRWKISDKTNKGSYPFADIVILATGVRPNTKFLEEQELKL